ncbi:MAG: hypothetical protein ACRC2J_06595 [Microcoleaceae cyanobacterium]
MSNPTILADDYQFSFYDNRPNYGIFYRSFSQIISQLKYYLKILDGKEFSYFQLNSLPFFD